MEQWIEQFTATLVGLFFAFSWAHFAIKINKLENKINKLENKDKTK